ncbi:MAG: class II aldolase/adducin family protein [Mobiluncus porci]|uniref:Class II aldolase/adducin family protein n=1 Tax=Mobiluncus porci TaxID=2652278 RepID=A0A7K0K1B5_9ACTO|nr:MULTISPECIES: class II aldolase/adducin family protein [Mobiluncus]MCI6584788.1 class II aldolase/adducin family protein [Mobiluncus sp.]MDD7540655.1 class II aldolase/adducin family protein [Mobiluncus porci]MDY5748218.1 class II aldolase/adducin family protein [Mobiluncus porci]MST49286.1 class II aldolase/adducin family protein [Mobiluncus porci]
MSTEQELREEICEIGQKVWQRGYVAANDGNISARMEDGNILCTPTGISKGSLTPDMICKLALDGTILSENPPYKTSSEVKVHLHLYRAEPKVMAVVHAHPIYGTAYAIGGVELVNKRMPENVLAMPVIPVAPYATPSSEELAENIEPYVHDYSVCLMEMHGALSWGPSLLAAYQGMERLEYTAKLTYLCDQMGFKDRELDDAEVKKLIGMRPQYGL